MKNICEVMPNKRLKTKVVQFGEGNFLRGFADYMIDAANQKGVFDGGVTIVKPIAYGNLDAFTGQDCVYTVMLRGRVGGRIHEERHVVTGICGAVDPYADYDAYAELAALPDLRFIISNTTEAGIVFDTTDDFDMKPPKSYPGKLTKFLYERYQVFGGSADKGLIVLPVELIEDNGKKLLDCVLRLIARWNLPAGFRAWVLESNTFCSTLVDRIITGYPKDEDLSGLGYTDRLVVTGEPFALWVIECENPGEVRAEFPLDKAGMPVIFTTDQRPYRERKVRILNGAHTATVPAAFLSGFDLVGECVADKTVRAFMEKAVYTEIAPTVPLPADEVREFADSVFERFENPYIKHELMSIALNSISKWKARVLPSLRDSLKLNGYLPECLTFSFAALAELYSAGQRGGVSYQLRDDRAVLDFFSDNREEAALIQKLAGREDFWGQDLNLIPGFTGKANEHLQRIRAEGMPAAMGACL